MPVPDEMNDWLKPEYDLTKLKPVVMVHYATGEDSACGVHICGGTFYTEKEKRSWNRSWYKPIQHTCALEDVTCKRCKRSVAYKNALKQQES